MKLKMDTHPLKNPATCSFRDIEINYSTLLDLYRHPFSVSKQGCVLREYGSANGLMLFEVEGEMKYIFRLLSRYKINKSKVERIRSYVERFIPI